MDLVWILCQAKSMDLLADILKTSGLKKRILKQKVSEQAWAMRFPCLKSMGFHVITRGEAWLWKPDQPEPLHLKSGDIAFMARGMVHTISTHRDPELVAQAQEAELCEPQQAGLPSSPLLAMISGAYQLWNEPIHPLFKELPEWVILRSENLNYADSLQHSLQLLASELAQPALGSEAICSSLLDILFYLILRRSLELEQGRVRSWSRAVEDPYVGKALQIMHAQPTQDWSLELLAREVGLSRSGFALKFKQVLGDTPLHYLATLRMLLAMEQLNETDSNLETVARAVGYQDAFSFSKSFKKLVGVSPKVFRQQNQADLASGWRF